MAKVKRFDKKWFLEVISIASICIASTWAVCHAILIEPRDLMIKEKEDKIADLEKKVIKLQNELKSLMERQNYKIKKLEISNIYYQLPGSDKTLEIYTDQTVEAGGKIWFEIKLPELGGYLLAYLKDSQGKMFNLFPGTKQAVINGYYRVPYHINNPRTQIQKITADNTIASELPLDRILIGSYTFDETKGDETFHFFYLDKRNMRLETVIIGAADIGKNIPVMRGILTKIGRFDPQKFGRTIKISIFYKNEIKLKLKHE